MASTNIILFAFLIIHVSCEQRNSLTFVIDDTGSMYNEISQVKQASKSIVDIVLNEKSSQIEDIVLVTFNDPHVRFRNRTRNGDELKQSLDAIRVNGGGDCAEMSLSGVKMALQESLPGSYLFVFTDASAKDYRQSREIQDLCQAKQSQVIFVLTNFCRPLGHRYNQVYHEIAAASNGQVFRVSKGEINQVLEYVKETIKGDRTMITSKVIPPHTWTEVQFNIDDKTEYAIVSASGGNVQLLVYKQFGRQITDYEEIMSTSNAKALKLTHLSPGTYIAKVHGTSEINVMVFARTDFTFEHGFSDKIESSLRSTETQPTTGTETHLMISVKDPEHSVNVQAVEILDMNQRVSKTLPLTHVAGDVYATDKFLPPEEMFIVAVTATARSTGKHLRRIAKTPVKPIKPVTVAPEISNAEKYIKAKEGAPVNIHCRIRQGKPRPQVTWYFKQQGAGEFTLITGSADEVLRMSSVALKDAGEYKCVAKNAVGHAEHDVRLDVEALPVIEKTPPVIKTLERGNVVIPCKVSKAAPPPTITWQFKNTESESFHNIDNTGELLRIVNVQLYNAGFYKCQVTNDVGTAQQTAQLIVLVPPQISKKDVHITVNKSSAVSLTCGITAGTPTPRFKWQFRHERDGNVHTLDATEGRLYIASAQVVDSGFYTCRAENEAGHDEHTMQVSVQAAPHIAEFPKIMTPEENSTVRIECKITESSPPPHTYWLFRPATADSHYIPLTNNVMTLELTNVQVSNSGYYLCVSRNQAGEAKQTVELVVQVRPEFEKTPPAISTKENLPVTIECKLRKGNPPPTITWEFRARNSAAFTAMNSGADVLSIPAVGLRQAGEYRCIAQNSAGRDKKITELTVLVPPEIEKNTPIVRVKENATTTIQCRIAKGFPDPAVTWFYKKPNSADYETIPTYNNNLLLNNIQLSNAGEYKCVAENTVGRAEQIVQLIVEAPPRIEFISPNKPWYNAVEGDLVMKLPCTAVGYPTPIVTWIVHENLIGNDKSQGKYVEDGTLFVKNPVNKDSTNLTNNSIYVCHASNPFGDAYEQYEVDVSEYADYNDSVQNYSEINKPYALNCSLPFTDPNSVRWFYDSIPMNITGPTLFWDKPNEENNGNYTCRVSDMNGAASATVKLTFGTPPAASTTFAEDEWNGDPEKEITCSVSQKPFGKYEWYYHGKKIKEASDVFDLSVKLIGWGQYVCRTSNPLGNLEITYNVTYQGCVIMQSLSKKINMPVILDAESAWPTSSVTNQNLVVAHLDKLTLSCPAETMSTKSASRSNSFTNFPSSGTITATCDREDVFLVDGVSHKFSELGCKERVSLSVVQTKQQCLGEKTIMMNVGFNADGFIEVYKSCLDMNLNAPLYTIVTMTGDYSSMNSEESNESKNMCETESDCCNESVQLVSKDDVLFGPAQEATLRKPLNYVSYCKPNDTTTSWYDIEKAVRMIPKSTVWSGVVNYTKVDKHLAPQYLWKVVKDSDTLETVAIVHSNTLAEAPAVCEDVCKESTWFEPVGPRTYCCRLDDFKKAFNLPIQF